MCVVLECESGLVDDDGVPDNGCEAACDPVASGAEICDGEDNDCDGIVDNAADNAAGCSKFYFDGDEDGAGLASDFRCLCAASDTHSATTGDDCNDGDANLFPGQLWHPDCDGDGFFASVSRQSCDEPTSNCVSTGSVALGGWTYNSTGADSDCDDTDDGLFQMQTWYADCDGDTFHTNTARVSCGPPSGVCNGGTDPASWRTSSPTLRDCNDENDEEKPGQQWYADCDDDGYFDADNRTASCGTPDQVCPRSLPTRTSNTWSHLDPQLDDDCDDDNGTRFPGQQWYPDCDNDGFFDSDNASVSCPDPGNVCPPGGPVVSPPFAWIHVDPAGAGDCNDDDINAFPTDPWYIDCDGDGAFRTTPVTTCGGSDGTCPGPSNPVNSTPDASTASANEDCRDAASTCVANCGQDADRDGTDDCADQCVDIDGDSWGPSGYGGACVGGYCRPGACGGGATDCNDAADTCTNNCEPNADGDGFEDCADACIDQDADNHGGGHGGTCDGDDCDIGGPCTGGVTDCDDTRAYINEDMTEICDGYDNDCSDGGGFLPLDESDDDGDGFVECGVANQTGYLDRDSNDGVLGWGDCADLATNDADCNDDRGDLCNPGEAEIAGDEVDQNCDGVEICFLDEDDDTYRPDSSSTVASADLDCQDPGEAVGTDPIGDCDDGTGAGDCGAQCNPGLVESSANGNCDDTFDNDCNGPLDCEAGSCVADCSASCSDVDGDGWSDCGGGLPDCDDNDSGYNPDALDNQFDGNDQNCNGTLDDGVACGADGPFCSFDNRTLQTCSGGLPAIGADSMCSFLCRAGQSACEYASNLSDEALLMNCDASAPPLTPALGQSPMLTDTGIACSSDCGDGSTVLIPSTDVVIDGGVNANQTVAVICVSDLSILGGEALVSDGSEANAVVLVVNGNATVAGTIDFRGDNAPPEPSTPGGAGGPGGGAGGAACTTWGCDGNPGLGPIAGAGVGLGGSGGSGGSGNAGGGAGASCAGTGGSGGSGGSGDLPGGVARAPYGNAQLEPLLAGSGGGGGGSKVNQGIGAPAGGGGGAVQISARGTLTVSGIIMCDGGMGADSNDKHVGAGGGGSGGGVLLEAATIVVSGGVFVDGGDGGTALDQNNAGGGATGATLNGTAGTDAGAGGGGGGGGGGRVRLNHPSAAASPICSALVSPTGSCGERALRTTLPPVP